MTKFVVLLEGWNDKREQDCMAYVITTGNDIESILNAEEPAEAMARRDYPQFNKFQILYVKELLAR